MVIMDNPLPASTGRVCQHPCGEPLSPPGNRRRRGHPATCNRYITDQIFSNGRYDKLATTLSATQMPDTKAYGGDHRLGTGGPDRRVLSGAAGAYRHRVESRAHAGGMLHYALPQIPPAPERD